MRACSTQINNASIIVHHNPLSELSTLLPIGGYFAHVSKFTKKAIAPQYELPDNVQLHIISFPYITPDASNRDMADKIAEQAIKLINKKGLEFDLIHAHFTWPQGGAGARLKERYDVPLIITAHGFDIYELPFKDANWNGIITQTLNHADQIITVSNNNVKCLERLNIRTPVTIIPNGFRADTFHPLGQTDSIRPKLGLPLRKQIILSVGNLELKKGHETLIESVKSLVKKNDNLLIVIVGSGQLRARLMKTVDDFGLSDYVVLAGRKPHAEIPLWMNACDVFALPSLAEGNPTVMFECLGCGKPFVGTRVGGIPDIITSDDYGLLCEPGDSKDLADKLMIALEKKWDNEKIVAYSRQFTWEIISKQIIEIYQKAIKGLPH